MTLELRPLGVKCNLSCQYCYQNPQRDAGNVAQTYDLETMKAAVLASRDKEGFTLFGGEPLLVPERDLEALFSWGLDTFGQNGVQTNGALINAEHIRMFKKYRVQVGISIDGPGPLNDARWQGTLEATREATAHTEKAIVDLLAEGLVPSFIVTLHRVNAAAEKLPQMHAWMRELDALGVQSMRLHILEVDHGAVREVYALSIEENIAAYRSFERLQRELIRLRFDVFADMREMLMGRDRKTTCVWAACDPFTTRAVQGIEGDGQRSNCGRTNKDGIDFVKSAQEGFERYLALYHTPQDFGGCAGCRFFLMCKGQCPGTSIDGDWRNRTEHCEVYKTIYRDLEGELLDRGVIPVSASPNRRQLEEAFLTEWARGKNPLMEDFLYGSGGGGGGAETVVEHGDAVVHSDHGDG